MVILEYCCVFLHHQGDNNIQSILEMLISLELLEF